MKFNKVLLLGAFSILFFSFSLNSLSQIKAKHLSPGITDVTGGGVLLPMLDQKMLQEVISRVKDGHIEEKTDKQLIESAVSGIMSSLDPHSSYMSEESLKEMRIQTKGEFGGLGIEITSDSSVIKVISAMEDTPASKVDIRSGDYIIKVSDKSIVGLSIEEVVKKLRGKPGTKVKISIARKGEKSLLEKELVRQIIKVKPVRSAKFDDILYLKINTFSEQAASVMTKELNKYSSSNSNLSGLVLDLRNNPGGLLDQAVAVGDLFLNKGQKIVSIKGRGKDTREFIDESNESLIKNIPVVILINEGSASASEIVAGALQDNKRAVVMGTKSFGKGSVQTVIPLEEGGGAIRLTTALYYTPNGRSIQAHGIIPDIELQDARIEKNSKTDKVSEADLDGHLKAQIKELELPDSQHSSNKKEDLSLYEKDYQLARAIDLLKGMSFYTKYSRDLIK